MDDCLYRVSIEGMCFGRFIDDGVKKFRMSSDIPLGIIAQ